MTIAPERPGLTSDQATRLDASRAAPLERPESPAALAGSVALTRWPASAAVVDPGTAPPRSRASRRLGARLLGGYVVAAVVTCLAVQPAPNGPDPDPGLWFDAVDLLAFVTLLVAAVLLWRAAGLARWAGLAAGVAMVVETATCPLSGHHMIMIGWWWWLQAGLSLVCLASGAGLARHPIRGRLLT